MIFLSFNKGTRDFLKLKSKVLNLKLFHENLEKDNNIRIIVIGVVQTKLKLSFYVKIYE